MIKLFSVDNPEVEAIFMNIIIWISSITRNYQHAEGIIMADSK